LNANVLFCRFKKNLTLCMAKLRALVLCFFHFKNNSNRSRKLARFGSHSNFLDILFHYDLRFNSILEKFTSTFHNYHSLRKEVHVFKC
jgi:hypothetical protein